MLETKTKKKVIKKEGIRGKIKKTSEKMNMANLELARYLYKVKNSALYKEWGFRSFAGFVEAEVDFSLRKAKELVGNWEILAALNISNEDAARTGWTTKTSAPHTCPSLQPSTL